MSALICGSIAFDTVMVFQGRFREQILADRIHMLNVSFLVPSMRRNFGGCAGNIAYSLKLLGGEPLPMGAVGSDGGDYLQRFDRQLERHRRLCRRRHRHLHFTGIRCASRDPRARSGGVRGPA